jgi:hypothetical protein
VSDVVMEFFWLWLAAFFGYIAGFFNGRRGA